MKVQVSNKTNNVSVTFFVSTERNRITRIPQKFLGTNFTALANILLHAHREDPAIVGLNWENLAGSDYSANLIQ